MIAAQRDGIESDTERERRQGRAREWFSFSLAILKLTRGVRSTNPSTLELKGARSHRAPESRRELQLPL